MSSADLTCSAVVPCLQSKLVGYTVTRDAILTPSEVVPHPSLDPMHQLKLVVHAGTLEARRDGLTGVKTTSFAIAHM